MKSALLLSPAPSVPCGYKGIGSEPQAYDGSCQTVLYSNDCLERTFNQAQHAAVTTMNVDKGRVNTVNAHDGPDFAHLLGQALSAGATTLIVNVE